jgi:Tol biopolymer transport system component
MGLDISPDNNWVASTSVKQPAPTVLLPTGAGQAVTEQDSQFFHTQRMHFLPDGKGLLMVAAEPGKAPRTYIMMLDGTAPKPVGPESFRGLRVSPDGKWVLGNKDNATWVIPTSGSDPGKALDLPPDFFANGWTADSKGIYVADPGGIPLKLYIMDLATGQRKLFQEFAPGDPSGVPGMGVAETTPDGKFSAYGVARTLSYLYVVEGLK